MPKRRTSGGDTPGQLLIPWSSTAPKAAPLLPKPPKSAQKQAPAAAQHLKWDFQESFPQPTEGAVENGIISDEDLAPESIQAIHREHAREMLAALHDIDAVMDARRRGIDPVTGHAPRTPAAKERLKKLLATEPARLERFYQNLLDTYADAFGGEAAYAFDKAIRARFAGIPVVADTEPVGPAAMPPMHEAAADAIQPPAPVRPSRIVARLPIPRPLAEAVRAGRFGTDEQNQPIRPDPDEVAEITVTHAEKLIDLLGPNTEVAYRTGLAAYAEDFGERPASQLDAYVRRLARLGERPELPRQRVRDA
jgi:hypothetical protein